MSQDTYILYRIQPSDPEAHLFQVHVRVPEPSPAGQVFSLPAWIPGSYTIRDFAKNVVWLRAQAEGGSVSVEKVDKQTWRCLPTEGPLTLTYEVYAGELSVRAAHLDITHGYFNGTSVFLRVHGQEDRPVVVDIERPCGGAYRAWRLATAMPRAGAEPHAFGRYCASDYEELVDHPVEMGSFTLVTFDVSGITHEIAVTGRHRADIQRLCRDLQAVCEYHVSLFGELPVDDRYVFLVMAVGDGYGGLEHRASCSLLCARDALPRQGQPEITEEYREFLGLCSHEYFHTWNVKRIKPQAFVPYDLSREVHTSLLWAFEGITSYYDELALVRAGRISIESYLELLGRKITRVLRGRGRFKQTVAESSFDAWIKFYKQDENAPNAIVSYYTKGALVALALDMTIRLASDQRQSLDDVMRILWDRYGRTGKGVPEDGVERVAEEIAGVSLKTFFDRAVRSTEDLALGPLLAEFGIELRLRPAESAMDKGGTPPAEESGVVPALGVQVEPGTGAALVTQVYEGSAAQESGLSAGDAMIAIDGIRADADSLEARLRRCRPDDRVRIHAFRRDELMKFDVVLKAPPADTCFLTLSKTQGNERLGRWLPGDSR